MTAIATFNMTAKRYPLAPNGVFWSAQGEAHLRGFQMAFVRLAGCSVGCDGCDTDYSVAERDTAGQIAARVDEITPANCRDRWVWITGGEPTDHDLRPLLGALRDRRFSTAVATSGHARMIPPVDWLSVSPHDPAKWVQTYGNEVKIVPGLHGLDIDDWRRAFPDDVTDFMYRYVQPLSKPEPAPFCRDCLLVANAPGPCAGCGSPLVRRHREDQRSLVRCLEFLKGEPNWSLSRQDHHHWGVA